MIDTRGKTPAKRETASQKAARRARKAKLDQFEASTEIDPRSSQHVILRLRLPYRGEGLVEVKGERALWLLQYYAKAVLDRAGSLAIIDQAERQRHAEEAHRLERQVQRLRETNDELEQRVAEHEEALRIADEEIAELRAEVLNRAARLR